MGDLQATEASSPVRICDLVGPLLEARSAYQQHLVVSSQARTELQNRIEDAKSEAARRSRRFRPNLKDIDEFEHSWAAHGVNGQSAGPGKTPLSLDEAEALWTTYYAKCLDSHRRFQMEHRDWLALKKGLFRKKPPEPRLETGFLNDLSQLIAVRDAVTGLERSEEERFCQHAVAEARATFDQMIRGRDDRLRELLLEKFASLEICEESIGTAALPWPERLSIGSPDEFGQLTRVTRLGSIRSGLPDLYSLHVPCLVSFPAATSLAIEADPQDRQSALELLRSIVLRTLMDVPPGQLRVSFIDPTAMGQTFAEFLHLTDYDERLVDVGVKTGSQAIERCLADHAAHVETIVSKYLRGQFRNIDDYNSHAGEMTEPLRLLVLADFPRSFTDRAVEQLLSVVENGPRSGVYTLLHYSPADKEPRGVSFDRLTQSMDVVRFAGGVCRTRPAASQVTVDFQPDRCPAISFDPGGRPSSDAARFLTALGAEAQRGTETVVTLGSFLPVVNRNRTGATPDFTAGAPSLTISPQTWWTATTSDTAVAPIGRSGALSLASLFFSSTAVAGGAIMVGLPRSGKTTSLHALILTMSMLYSPEELELYLIDAKHGVEFKTYDTLPHARMVSVHSEREFSVAVLKSIQSKIRERAELIKREGSGYSNLTEYRHGTGQPLPRIVVVIDEFHELFEEADPLGFEAFAAFSDIVRMGPFSGIHIVVASQTLSSMPAMDRQVLTLLPQRVAFMCNEYDAEIVMGDANKAPRMLNKTGEGLFNPARGDEAKNQLFRGLYIPPEERSTLVHALRTKANESGWTRLPRVFDGDAVVPRPFFRDLLQAKKRFTVPVGEPFTLADTASVSIPRARGGNVLLIGDHDDDETPDRAIRGVLHSVLSAAAPQHASVTVVDFIGDEYDDHGCSVMELADAIGARYARSSMLASVLHQLADEVTARTLEGNYGAPSEILILVGIQRALSLVPVDPYASNDEEPSLPELLATVLVNGPEVGVHTVVNADRSRSAEIRLGGDLLGEFAVRIAGSAADQRDLSFVRGSFGDVPALRTGQILIGDLARGTTRRVRGYDLIASTSGLEGRG